MKTGKSLQELARTLERNAEAKVDMVADTRDITMTAETNALALTDQEFAPTDHCHNQIAQWSGIGRRYYQKMKDDSPALLAGNVNHWLHKESDAGTRRMVRSLDGKARAFLSDHFLRLDNEHVAEATFRALEGVADIQTLSCEITERKLYMKFAFPRTEREVEVGDAVQSGVIVTNSEIGGGSFQVYPFIYRLICLNGMVSMKRTGDGYRRTHRGARIQNDGVVYQQDTIEAAAQAALLECRDAVTTFANEKYFDRYVVETLRAAAATRDVDRPARAVETLAKAKGFSFTETEQESVLERFIRGGDYSKWGMLNAVTNLANDVDDYDRASELEVLGGKVLDLSPSQWETIALAA